MFRLATHYWEGRWLLEMAAIPAKDLDRERKKQGRAAVEARWRRRMMLTPCAVSTFYMLPSVMKFQRAENGSFVPEYLYNFIDLLIVDEAGQVLPEVAGASFALAKNALVIGDTMQISPIWAIPRHVDVGNLIAHGLVEPGHAGTGYDAIVEAGKASASGSVMRIAQHASPYQYDPDLSPGLYLYEHRRCYDDIIDYCNALCYKGKLVPKRGPRPPDQDGLPALGYLHVDGMCQRNSSGSSFNNLEAATIAAWLAANKETLEARYQKPLSQVVGVVTPFSAQVSAISKACPELDITIGTVHALQGAERPVVIFSSVYSKHQDGQFIDRYPSMLNVAVSRAKDSFLVFGDMDVLELAPPSLPRGMLAASLFTEPGNALDFDMGARTDLEVHAQLTHLRDAGEHDVFLLETLATAQREVRIVTPWIQAKKVGEAVWDGFLKAVRRGVAIHIYTDGELNTASSNPEESARKREELDALLDMMAREGMRAVVVRRVHSKIVTVDANTYCVGSFNWFSASRDEAYARHETSLVYRGSALEREIESVKDSLERRMVCDYCQKREAA
jgi:hypothetical protein